MTAWPSWWVNVTDPNGSGHRMEVHAANVNRAGTTATIIASVRQHARLVAS